MSHTLPPLLIALPDGINVSGVTMWAVRLANALVQCGGEAGLMLHPVPRGQGKVGLRIESKVRRFECASRFGEGADLAKVASDYRAAVRELAGRSERTVIISPNLHGDCYGIAAKLTQDMDVRVLGWQHSDIEYDARVLMHYESIVSRFVAVSNAIEDGLRKREEESLAEAQGARGEVRVSRVVNVPYGVEVPREWPARRAVRERRLSTHPWSAAAAKKPVTLVYSGRMEHMQKRVTALVHMADELRRREVPHSFTLIGDGPAAGEIDAMIAMKPDVRRLAPVGPLSVAAMLEEHDAMVLPSRYEGLSVSVLEAMAHGCVPIVAKTRSGAMQAVGESGLIVDVGEDAEEEEVGVKMAAAVERFASMDRAVMSLRVWERARDLFSIERHVERVMGLLRDAAAEPARVWPRERPCAFTGADAGGIGVPPVRSSSVNGIRTGGTPMPPLPPPGVPMSGTGSVPADGAARLKALLDSLAGRSIVIHGTGEHTRQLKEVIVSAPVHLVAFTDDDRGKHGTRLWDWAVVSPREAASRGATDVVISSWMHQEAVWARRGVYEGMGVKVWRVYV